MRNGEIMGGLPVEDCGLEWEWGYTLGIMGGFGWDWWGLFRIHVWFALRSGLANGRKREKVMLELCNGGILDIGRNEI